MTENSSVVLASRMPYPEFESLGSASAFLDDILEFVMHIPLLDSFDRKDIETLAAYLPCFGCPGGADVLREGEYGDYLLLILTGEIVIRKGDPITGEPRLLAVAGPGSTLGEMSLFDGEPRFATCTTVTPTDFAVLTRQALDEVTAQHPALGNRLLMVLLVLVTRRLRKTSNDLLPHLAATATV